jgi:hypothetical protein
MTAGQTATRPKSDGDEKRETSFIVLILLQVRYGPVTVTLGAMVHRAAST